MERKDEVIYPKNLTPRQRKMAEETARYAQSLPGIEEEIEAAIEADEQGRTVTLNKGESPKRPK